MRQCTQERDFTSQPVWVTCTDVQFIFRHRICAKAVATREGIILSFTGYMSMCMQSRWTSFKEDSPVLTNTRTVGLFSFLWQSSSEPGPAGRAELCLLLGYVWETMDSPMNELIFNYMAECNIARL